MSFLITIFWASYLTTLPLRPCHSSGHSINYTFQPTGPMDERLISMEAQSNGKANIEAQQQKTAPKTRKKKKNIRTVKNNTQNGGLRNKSSN
uniref:Putative secreted protein n=1 Tax=Anopheles triannulatus TaxID=58253 RepID=A0A2M4B0V8_9DIPT